MHGSPELLEFYLVEATEYIDALDQVVGDGSRRPDTNALLATARALRGSSTMAKVDPVAELSAALEQIAARARDGSFTWTEELHRSLRGAVDDLRACVRSVRVWSDREQQRIDGRVLDLQRYTDVAPKRATPPSVESTTPVFVALQAAAIAAELDAFVSAPENRRSLDDAVGRTRTLRGIAGIADFPPLADVAETVEGVSRKMMPDAQVSSEEGEVFRAAAAIFRSASEQLRAHNAYVPNGADEERFTRAVARAESPAKASPSAPMVRIEQLFFAEPAPSAPALEPATPPLSHEHRTYRELVTRAEHIMRLVGDARDARDQLVVARVRKDLRAAIRDIESLSASSDAHMIAAFFSESLESADVMAAEELDALAMAARAILSPFSSLDDLERRIGAVTRLTPTASSAPDPDRTPVFVSRQTPTGQELKAFLASGIAGFRPLEAAPLSEPADLTAGELLSIDQLVFTGSSALARARALRDARRSRGTPEDESLKEIFDLLDLASGRQ